LKLDRFFDVAFVFQALVFLPGMAMYIYQSIFPRQAHTTAKGFGIALLGKGEASDRKCTCKKVAVSALNRWSLKDSRKTIPGGEICSKISAGLRC
jgi:hypothetical protein